MCVVCVCCCLCLLLFVFVVAFVCFVFLVVVDDVCCVGCVCFDLLGLGCWMCAYVVYLFVCDVSLLCGR